MGVTSPMGHGTGHFEGVSRQADLVSYGEWQEPILAIIKWQEPVLPITMTITITITITNGY